MINLKTFSSNGNKLGALVLIVPSLAVSLFLNGCEVTPRANASADCKDEIRQQMRDPSSVQIRFISGEETSTNTFLNRYQVRGTNGFGATTQETWVCRWEQTYQGDGGWSDYRYRIRVWREPR